MGSREMDMAGYPPKGKRAETGEMDQVPRKCLKEHGHLFRNEYTGPRYTRAMFTREPRSLHSKVNGCQQLSFWRWDF